MPLPQSFDRKGTADTLQTSIATMNNDAFGFIVLIVLLCWVVLFSVVIFLLFIIIDNKNGNYSTTFMKYFLYICNK